MAAAAAPKSNDAAGSTKLPKISLLMNNLIVPKKSNPLSILSPIEQSLLKNLFFSSREQLQIISKWAEMTERGVRKMTYRNFTQYFGFRDETWIRRLFDIMNNSLTGFVTFGEFLQFCLSYLIIDKDTTEELSFRLLSRRGATYVAKWSVLDLEDMMNFISFRYTEFKKLSKKQKRALDVLTAIDLDEDGGVDIKEFQAFCSINPVFPRLSHAVQNYLRRRLFGLDFWVRKSRKVKYSRTTGFESLLPLSMVNSASEKYTAQQLKDPVLLGRRKEENEQPNDNEENDNEHTQTSKIPHSGPTSFSFYDISLQRPYAVEFAEVARAANERRLVKKNQKIERKLQIRSSTGRVYDRLVMICGDFVHQRRGIRLGFNRWLEVIGKTPKQQQSGLNDKVNSMPTLPASAPVNQPEINIVTEEAKMKESEKKDTSIYSRIISTTKNRRIIEEENCVDDYIEQYQNSTMNTSDPARSNRRIFFLQLNEELRTAKPSMWFPT